MPYQQEADAIAGSLTVHFSGTDWDFVRQKMHAYMLSEIGSNLPNANFPTDLKNKLLNRFRNQDVTSLKNNIHAFLGSRTI